MSIRGAIRFGNVLVLALVMTACAGAKLKKSWKEERGYADADVSAIETQAEEYLKSLAQAEVSSNAFNNAPVVEYRGRMKSVFCACVKKLGEKCRQKNSGLQGTEKALWIKANAVDMAMVARSTSWETSTLSQIDPDECGG